jgi:hypothetical protein
MTVATRVPSVRRPERWGAAVVVVALAGALTFSVTARGVADEFLASLRIAKPQAVNVTIPGAAGSNGARQLQNMVGGMVARNVNVLSDEADQPATGAAAAAKLAGFTARLPRARTDPPTMAVTGAHAIEMTVDLGQLRTTFAQAGKRDVPLPASVEGAMLAVRTPRAIRAQYGNCPAPVAATLQNQLQGPPPPSTDNANCIVLVESPAVSADIPSGLDMGPLMEIALELSGMSPVQAQAVPQTLDWKSTLAVSLPRNLRSFEMKEVNGAQAMLLITAGRRGPTWELVWAKSGIVYTLTGYGNAGDAVPLANSLN